MPQDSSELITTYFEDEMKTSYLNYAYSVITARAIPDTRDGVKPVHRRILYAMSELALWHDKPTRKSARVVGDVLGKYHPHGDSSVYMAAVKMAQDFSIRYPLVIGQGNFGSIDDDPPAAMRYTEMKLSRVAEYMLEDLKKETVDFRPNFDETLKEPTLLPGVFPNLLCNGTTGIAVGFATDVPPHNLGEVVNGIQAYIKNPKITTRELMKYVKGPDYPTHGLITNAEELEEIYNTGHGSIHLAGKIHYEEKGSQRMLVITEIPYRVVKSKLVEEISNLVLDSNNKYSLILKGIKEVRDESSKEGIRIVVTLFKDGDAEALKTVLYQHTSLTRKQTVNIVVLVKKQPRVLGLKELIHYYVEHRREVIVRRTKFELDKAEKELHIIEGLLIALVDIDKIIKTIKESKDVATARKNLIANFKIDEIQAQAILDMRLQKLTNLEHLKLEQRRDELVALIAELKGILNSDSKRDEIIVTELKEMNKEIGDERRTQFKEITVEKIEQEELIENDAMMLTVSKHGFLIREVGNSVKTSSRGSKGRRGDATDVDNLEDGDTILATINGFIKDTVLFVTDDGRVYSLKGYEIKGQVSGKVTRGHIRNIDRLKEIDKRGSKITAVMSLEEFLEDNYIIFITKLGKVARISLDNFSNINKNGIIAMKLAAKDAVAGAVITDGNQKIFVVKRSARGFKLDEKKIPTYNRGVGGAKGTAVSGFEDEVIGMGLAEDQTKIAFIATDGRGKIADVKDFSEFANRGGKGFKLVDIGKRVLADFTDFMQGDALVITSKQGIRIFIKSEELSGHLLKMIDLRTGDEVSSISAVENSGE